ncbi:MAG: aminotransferase class V-fold PLP-dependent enzyme, partial [Calditrichaeota bacterium]|nr:aminotransferase class V-fold PLP-dependent enzyme [Calditrichota bacterium]
MDNTPECDIIYLDNGATTWPKPQIVHEKMTKFYQEFGVNPGRSGYDRAIEAESVVQQCRTRLSKFFGGGKPDRLVFAYNATDALNQIIQGVLYEGGHAISTNLEHNSVLRPLWHMELERGAEVTYLEFDENGFINPDDILKSIRSDTKLVIVNHSSNVIGTCQPVTEIGKICKDHGIFFAVDASQSA